MLWPLCQRALVSGGASKISHPRSPIFGRTLLARSFSCPPQLLCLLIQLHRKQPPHSPKPFAVSHHTNLPAFSLDCTLHLLHQIHNIRLDNLPLFPPISCILLLHLIVRLCFPAFASRGLTFASTSTPIFGSDPWATTRSLTILLAHQHANCADCSPSPQHLQNYITNSQMYVSSCPAPI